MHRIVDRAPPFVFYGGGSYKSIFSYLIDAYSEDTGNPGCLCEEEPGGRDLGGRLDTTYLLYILNFEPCTEVAVQRNRQPRNPGVEIDPAGERGSSWRMI